MCLAVLLDNLRHQPELVDATVANCDAKTVASTPCPHALQEGSTIDALWGAIVPAKPASTGIERDRQRHKGGCCAGGVSSKSPLPGL
jgi:hypothetical protein